ncbi:hypothetical protein GGC64_004725 [Mycobacterium sp. OAS707]|uniref:hypothetical protein n=1 Tax=Mycobacterium sp. OAS707 TaxID=2663822 RepID=UPI00178BB955|nr:hypothetical protein [Mycobacterium sp. OAS707]MBE1550685.1 hypothetical protein [Mycobacterium sp. OAS707]
MIINLVIGGVVIASVVGPFAVSRMKRIRGPVEPATARVITLSQWGSMSVNTPVPRTICRIRLRIERPGREPYTATVWQNIDPWDIGAVEPGRTVAVDIDTTKPKKLRINLSRSAQPFAGPDVLAHSPFGGQSTSPGRSLAALVVSAAELLASGQRVPAVLKSFAAIGTTAHSLGRTSSRPELQDAPHYLLEVELQFPNLAPVAGRAIQPVPRAQVPRLAIGLKLPCVVDAADPSRRFVVDWAQL